MKLKSIPKSITPMPRPLGWYLKVNQYYNMLALETISQNTLYLIIVFMYINCLKLKTKFYLYNMYLKFTGIVSKNYTHVQVLLCKFVPSPHIPILNQTN